MRVLPIAVLLVAMPGCDSGPDPAKAVNDQAQPQKVATHEKPAVSPAAVGTRETTETLQITVGEPTKLSALVNQNSASVAVSRTGVIAAFYPKPGTGPKFYRISRDGGRTWSQEKDFPPAYAGMMSVGLREGGVLFMLATKPVEGGKSDQLEARRITFTDDFLEYELGTSAVSIPDIVAHTKWVKHGWPSFGVGKIVQLANGDLLGTLYGNLKGDNNWYRTMLLRSKDQGESWQYHASIAFSPDDPDPQLAGQYCGYCEPSLASLPDGRLLCIMRTQGTHYPGEYRPLYQCWSDDLGKTWTRPTPSKPHLMNIAPVLAVLDNSVAACVYGRPGFHVAFSLDSGHTWQDRISFSDLPVGVITGQFDIVKVGPNRLVTIGSDADGTKVWPLTVGRVKVSATGKTLHGRVLDEQGKPIANATIERSPNRYTADDWLEHESKLDHWGGGTPVTVGSPSLGFRSIRKENGHPTVKSDAVGRFDFPDVPLSQYVLTVEADGYAPQHRHVNVRSQARSQDFRLKPGRLIRSRVMDETGRGIPDVCVVLNRWHVHTDSGGYFHWSLQGPAPQQVTLVVHKKYNSRYQTLKTTVALSELESQPITLKHSR
jgi:hypothetical protein